MNADNFHSGHFTTLTIEDLSLYFLFLNNNHVTTEIYLY